MRLIDADALKAEFERYGVYAVIDCAPTVDAVEVVRCKDCKYSRTNGKLYECPFFDEIRGDEFCSSGERKNGAKMTEGENE